MRHIIVEGILVDKKVLETKFCCDYSRCNGACCHANVGYDLNGGSLTLSEAAEILFHYKQLRLFCDEDAQKVPPFYLNGKGAFTTLVQDKCVFCNFTEKTCALKMAHKKGIISFGIPKSCELYPIVLEISHKRPRVKGVQKRLILSDLFADYCQPAYELGERKNVYLIEFLKNSIIRNFGLHFYQKLWDAQQKYLNG